MSKSQMSFFTKDNGDRYVKLVDLIDWMRKSELDSPSSEVRAFVRYQIRALKESKPRTTISVEQSPAKKVKSTFKPHLNTITA